MKLKLKYLKPNPYKSWINEGKLNQEQIETIKASLDDLGLMGSIPIVKRNNNYHLVSHHHRVEALKQKFGIEYEVDVTLHNYDDEQLFRGMVVENLTQRRGEFREELENLVAIQQFLKNTGVISDSEKTKSIRGRCGEGRPKTVGVGEVSSWLNKQGEVMASGKISELLQVATNLAKELIDEVEKTHTKGSKSINGFYQPSKVPDKLEWDEKSFRRPIRMAFNRFIEGMIMRPGEPLASGQSLTDLGKLLTKLNILTAKESEKIIKVIVEIRK